jgi:tRNA threonylcarbamoyladenosine biosynthesis protein TsaE
MQQFIADADAMEAFGARLASLVTPGMSIFLRGDLGAGKTTLVRGFLHALGHRGAVKSPTYTLVEPYLIDGLNIFHFDLYRLNDPEELEFMGIRDYMGDDSIRLIEWPQQGEDFLGQADLNVQILYQGDARELLMEAGTERGRALLESLGE